MVPLAILLIALASQERAQSVKETPVFPQLYHPPTHGPTLSEFTLRVPVMVKEKGKVGTVSFPAPSDYSGQVIVSLKVESQPPSALKAWKWEDRADKLNSCIVATVAPEGKGAWITYTAEVLCPPEPVVRTMVKPDQAWQSSTACVQSTDPEIKFLAQKLKEGAKDQEDYVNRVTMWVALNNGQKGEKFTSLDAKRGLKCGGSCTNRANLCAALLRANGIPARTVAHMPTWAVGKFYQHWLTEYWTEDGNWAMVEPTLGVKHPARNTVIVLAISSTEDEDKAFDKQHLEFSMPGSPYLSLAEASTGLYAADLTQDDAINEVHLLKTFPNQSTPRIMTSGYRRSLKVREAARLGKSMAYEQPKVLQSIAKGPGDFSMLLDGKQ